MCARKPVRTYSTWRPGGKPPCAAGTYSTREAGTRSLHVPYGGPGAYVSAQAVTSSSWLKVETKRIPAATTVDNCGRAAQRWAVCRGFR